MYYITSYRHGEDGYWEACKASTLRGAKIAATRRLGRTGYTDSELRIAVGDNVTAPREVIAYRRHGGPWVDVDY